MEYHGISGFPDGLDEDYRLIGYGEVSHFGTFLLEIITFPVDFPTRVSLFLRGSEGFPHFPQTLHKRHLLGFPDRNAPNPHHVATSGSQESSEGCRLIGFLRTLGSNSSSGQDVTGISQCHALTQSVTLEGKTSSAFWNNLDFAVTCWISGINKAPGPTTGMITPTDHTD